MSNLQQLKKILAESKKKKQHHYGKHHQSKEVAVSPDETATDPLDVFPGQL